MELPNWIYWIPQLLLIGIGYGIGSTLVLSGIWWLLNKIDNNENDYEGI